jgi:predicted small secreted protein
MLSNIRIIALRSALLLVVLAPLTMALSACDTTEGFGKDVSHTGDAITDTARDAK